MLALRDRCEPWLGGRRPTRAVDTARHRSPTDTERDARPRVRSCYHPAGEPR
jgi:hypothetical protein